MILVEDRSSPTKIYIELIEGPDGSIKLDGHDVGEAPKSYFGKSDYEYGLSIPAEGVRALAIQLLAEKYRNDASAVSSLMSFCEAHQILCSFWSYPVH